MLADATLASLRVWPFVDPIESPSHFWCGGDFFWGLMNAGYRKQVNSGRPVMRVLVKPPPG